MKTWQKLKNNPGLFQRYFVKEYCIKAIRNFFESRKYHELESPILATSLPQERYLDILETSIPTKKSLSQRAFLIPSTETFNKKMLAAGLGEHFVISKVFRGLEDIGPSHLPEFTMLEWYHLNATYEDLMTDCEELLLFIKKYLDTKQSKPLSAVIQFQNIQIDLTPPWHRISIREALKKYMGITLEDIETLDQIRLIAQNKGYTIQMEDDWQYIFEYMFLNEIEEKLPRDKPIFIFDYPRILCPLTKVKESDSLVCEKVELYMAGMELGNGYTEQTDAIVQKECFRQERRARRKMGKKEITFDNDLIDALNEGLPAVAGMGLGIDRLAMILANATSIAEVNYFPLSEYL